MELVPAEINQRRKYGSRLLRYELVSIKPVNRIVIKKFCVVVGEMGSGKSTFLSAYLSKLASPFISTTYSLIQSLKTNDVEFSNKNELNVLIRNRIWRTIGSICRNQYFTEIRASHFGFSDQDSFDDIIDRPFNKEILSRPIGDGGDGTLMALFPGDTIVEFLKNSPLIGRVFTLKQVKEVLSQLCEAYLTGISNIGPKFISNYHDFAAADCLQILKFLVDLNSINSELGISMQSITEKFNVLGSTNNWAMNFELREREVFTGRQMERKQVQVLLPVFYLEGTAFLYSELSDTQRLIVHRNLIEIVYECLDLNLKDFTFTFDEPTAYLDPASFDILLEFISTFKDAKQIVFSTHDPIILMKAIESQNYDVVLLKQSANGVEIEKITNNPFKIRRVINRMTDGRTFYNGTDNILESFLRNTFESTLVFCEGKYDVALLEFFQEIVIEHNLFSLPFRKYLATVKFLHFFDEDGVGGVGNLRKIIEQFKMNHQKIGDRRIIAVFDGDDAGFNEVYKLEIGASNTSIRGKLLPLNSKTGCIILPVPISITEDFRGKTEVQIEHTLYHKRSELSLMFDSKGCFSSSQKSSVLSKIKSYLKNCDKLEKEATLKELYKVVQITRKPLTR